MRHIESRMQQACIKWFRLQFPDLAMLMFRRFRYKDPDTGEWRRKWKKRVIDSESGKVSFIDYDKDSYSDQWTGRGYYKSSAQNAMRVARTETNIAYRRADHARWQQMDFVIGQRVHLSRSHPRRDICDKLAGDYPKDFVFDGWHPQCFCYVTPILVDEDLYDDIMNRDDWREQLQKYASAHHIDDCPKNFHSWVADNNDRLAGAAKRGTTPYFIANNAKYTDPKWKPSKTSTAVDDEWSAHQKAGNYGAAMKLGSVEEKLGRKIYKHAAVTSVSEAQEENIAEAAGQLGIRREEIKPMDFNKADGGMGNIDYGNGDAYTENCPATIAAHEARLRGLNVTARGFDKEVPEMIRVQKRYQDIWIDPRTGAAPTPQISGIEHYNKKKWKLADNEIIEKAENLMQAPGRYHIGINQLNGDGHVIVAERMADGTLICFDAQAQTFVDLTDWSK